MRGLSVIIPSKTVSNLIPCVAAVKEYEPAARLIVVDDGLDEWPSDGVTVVQGEKPFSFPRNCNIGICAVGDDDVILLNDDALLKTRGGFTLMQEACMPIDVTTKDSLKSEYIHSKYGLISSTTNVAGNPSQRPNPKNIGLRDEPRTVAFVCVFIPRRTLQEVGFMDERFGGLTPEGKRIYGFCDNDYCRRVRNAGLKIGIHDGCYVDHGSLRSSFRGHPHAAGDISEARKLYQAKWGDVQ